MTNKSANDNADDVYDCTYLFFMEQSSVVAIRSPEANMTNRNLQYPWRSGVAVQIGTIVIVDCCVRGETQKLGKHENY